MHLFKRRHIAEDIVEQPFPEHDKPNKLLLDIVLYILPLASFLIWWFSLRGVNVRQMNDLGLISVFPPSLIGALVLLTISFSLLINQPKVRKLNLFLHFGLLIFMLFAVTILVEEMPRFAIVYRHMGYTEYIMRTGSVNPYIDAYFSWPAFFSLSAFLTKMAGYNDILSFAGWAPVFYNVIYAGPLYMIYSTFTKNKRIIWFALWLFYLTNWIAQDYFSPQGFHFFLYLTLLAILLTWFKTAPEAPIRPLPARLKKIPFLEQVYMWLREPDQLASPTQSRQHYWIMIAVICLIFSFIVSGHQLTPFFTILAVGSLAITRRCQLWWLPIVMGIVTTIWIVVVAQPYLVGHTDQVFGSLGKIFSSFSSNVSDRVGGSPEHTFIARMRILMSLFVWGIAGLGALFRWYRGHNDATIILLAICPFPLFIVQPYGGEMLLRSYLFGLGPMTFLMASFLYAHPFANKVNVRVVTHSALCILALGGFLYTRYGNESMDYITRNEYEGVRHLYEVAPQNSFFLDGWWGVPWQIKDFEKYSLYIAAGDDKLTEAVEKQDVATIARFLKKKRESSTNAYVIFTRSQKQTFNATSGLPAGHLDQIEQKMAKSGYFNLIYSNSDAQIFQFIDIVDSTEEDTTP